MLRDTSSKNQEGRELKAVWEISYTYLRELFIKKISDLGLPPSNFGLHRLRAGGATAAANAKIPRLAV